MQLYQIMAVVDRDQEQQVRRMFWQCGAAVGLSQTALGTAPNEALDRYGLARMEKRIVSAVADEEQRVKLFRQARRQLSMDIPGRGILTAIPIKSVMGKQTLAFLSDSEIKGGAPRMEFEYELIVVILNEGFSDTVMDAARAAGAGGGTLLHAKGTGGERARKFFKVSLASEKDMIYIVAHRDEKAAIMKAIHAAAGPATEAGGVCFSMPISSVMGLRAREVDGE